MAEWGLVADVGSTTTKALAFRQQEGTWRLQSWVQEPTTVEAPDEDVMIGLQRAIARLSGMCRVRFLVDGAADLAKGQGSGSRDFPLSINRDSVGFFLATSSAGGGLGILACGATLANSARLARRVAMGAGGNVLDVIAPDDGRQRFETFAAVRALRPDMILVAGGVDGGNTSFVLELIDLLNAARPAPKFGRNFRIPLIFAGNKDAAPLVADSASEAFLVHIVPNVQPTLTEENLTPARQAIHELFMTHVMAHAPGYDRLTQWVDAPVLPTPAAVSRILELAAGRLGGSVVAIDIGGATTDVYSSGPGGVVRTVTANAGMSYSAPLVLAEAGSDAISQWLPGGLTTGDLENWVALKGTFPSLVPHYPEDLVLDHALARAAIRLAVRDHVARLEEDNALWHRLARRGRGATGSYLRWDGGLSGATLVVGSGGVLSHAPQRVQAAAILVDALLPTGVTELAVDSVFMMPHLGALSQIADNDALELFFSECLVPLGTVLAPAGEPGPEGRAAFVVKGSSLPGGIVEIRAGELLTVPVPLHVHEVRIEPAKTLDMGAGPGKALTVKVKGGEVGLILDARGRPLRWPRQEAKPRCVERWLAGMGVHYGESEG